MKVFKRIVVGQKEKANKQLPIEGGLCKIHPKMIVTQLTGNGKNYIEEYELSPGFPLEQSVDIY